MRIGRSALDEEAIRLIEEHNPDVEFDWTRILKGQEDGPRYAGLAPADRQAILEILRETKTDLPPDFGR